MEQLDFSESPSVEELVAILGVSRDTAIKIEMRVIRSLVTRFKETVISGGDELSGDWIGKVQFNFCEIESETVGENRNEEVDWGNMMKDLFMRMDDKDVKNDVKMNKMQDQINDMSRLMGSLGKGAGGV